MCLFACIVPPAAGICCLLCVHTMLTHIHTQVRLALAGKGPLNEECYLHPGRKGCKVERLLAADA